MKKERALEGTQKGVEKHNCMELGSTALCFTLKLPSAISMFVRDPEPLLSHGELWVSLTCTAVWPNLDLD